MALCWPFLGRPLARMLPALAVAGVVGLLSASALAVLANVVAGFWNGWRDGLETYHLANRAVSILAVVLVGFLAIRAREASERSAALAQEERELARERARRQLAEEMGGSLAVSSEPGRGTRVRIEMPTLAQTSADGGESAADSPDSMTISSAQTGRADDRMRVLYVEDNRINALLFAEALRPHEQRGEEVDGGLSPTSPLHHESPPVPLHQRRDRPGRCRSGSVIAMAIPGAMAVRPAQRMSRP